MEQLGTPETAQAAGVLLAEKEQFARAKESLERLLAGRRSEFTQKQIRSWRRAVHSGILRDVVDPPSHAFALCWEIGHRVEIAEAKLAESLERELAKARQHLHDAAQKYLPRYLIFAARGVHERVTAQLTAQAGALSPRNKQARADERHLILYLQRIAGKNDSLSEFGPHGWGMIRRGAEPIEFDPQPGIAQREVFLERWTAHGIAQAINADPEALAELSPRLNPFGRLEAAQFVFTETGETVSLDRNTAALLRRCDGRPAYSLGTVEELQGLARQKLIVWELEVPALHPHAFNFLLEEISHWRENPTRARWLELLESIATLTGKFAQTLEGSVRFAIMEEAHERLARVGSHKESTRFLYAATNPIGEECFRDCGFTLRGDLLDEVITEAEPWIDLWRDNYAFVAGRVAAGLRAVFEEVAQKDAALPLPYFLHLCAQEKLPLSGAGMVALAHLAFREVKEGFRERLRDRGEDRICQLSVADCHFVRQNFSYTKFDECTYPSADLQLAAASPEAATRGECQWILAELHPPVALLHHGFYWSCPDKAALREAIERTLHGRPYLYYGYFAADFTATTAVRLDALPGMIRFVAPQRSAGKWQTFRPAETEVFIDETGDVGVRTCGAREYLGSFARGWVIPLGFHPFSFSLGAHTPRLRCGKVIVQREAWTVTLEELGQGDFTGVSRDLIVAVEKLRAARALPRRVYIRPTEKALRRAGVEGRDKDTKPVFIDLESYLFLEIFHRWLTKAGELEVTEMLPTPEQLLWQEADGRRTFELRTQIVPR